MCYPKPRLRCSYHARKRLQSAQEQFSLHRDDESFARLVNARTEYFASPEGRNLLMQKMNNSSSEKERAAYAADLEAADSIKADSETLWVSSYSRNDEFKSIIDQTGCSPARLTQIIHSKIQDLIDRGESVSEKNATKVMDRARRLALSESIVDSAELGVEITKPLGTLDHYDLDEDGRPRRVWYSSYGSNMQRGRMMNYIAGGTPPGGSRSYAGTRNPAEPRADIPVKYNHPVHFGLNSKVWSQGGIAFLDETSTGRSFGRAYDITVDQFDDVVAQENGTDPDGTKLDIRDTITRGSTLIHDGAYGMLVHVGDYKGAPVLTFTAPGVSTRRAFREGETVRYYGEPTTFRPNNPSQGYRDMISQGLKETFALTDEQCATYIDGSQGANL